MNSLPKELIEKIFNFIPPHLQEKYITVSNEFYTIYKTIKRIHHSIYNIDDFFKNTLSGYRTILHKNRMYHIVHFRHNNTLNDESTLTLMVDKHPWTISYQAEGERLTHMNCCYLCAKAEINFLDYKTYKTKNGKEIAAGIS